MAWSLGPILQFRGVDSRGLWCVSVMMVGALAEAAPAARCDNPSAQIAAARLIAQVPLSQPTRSVWRVDLAVPLNAGRVHGTVSGLAFSFYVPVPGESPRMAYGSCNGFSDPKLMKHVDRANDRWLHMAGLHEQSPYHLLLLGGDQVYSDEMWKTVPELTAWLKLDKAARLSAPFSRSMRRQVDALFARIYVERWAQPEVAAMMARLPSVMMWDDHEIIDGWGSYPAEQHSCPVYQGIFQVARRYFRIFQWQCGDNEVHPAAIPDQDSFSLGFAGLGEMVLLVPDLRSERQPALPDPITGKQLPERILSPASWEAIYRWMSTRGSGHRHLLLMSSIPVAYLDLSAIEKLLDTLPGQQELEDDLRDHWRSNMHLQERLRLIHRLLAFATEGERRCRVTILSGDVHVGALSVIESTRDEHAGPGSVINQLVSTGIVHPAPPALVRYVLEKFGTQVDPVDRGITATMQPIRGRGRYLIGARNWLALEPDLQGRLWANWHVEGLAQPLTKVIHG